MKGPHWQVPNGACAGGIITATDRGNGGTAVRVSKCERPGAGAAHTQGGEPRWMLRQHTQDLLPQGRVGVGEQRCSWVLVHLSGLLCCDDPTYYVLQSLSTTWTTTSRHTRLWSNAALMAWTACLGAWYTVRMCSIFTQENCYGHAICRLCQVGSTLSHRTARVAPSRDLDRVLPAVLSPSSHRLPLPSLRPGGGATYTTANTSPCTDNGLTGDG